MVRMVEESNTMQTAADYLKVLSSSHTDVLLSVSGGGYSPQSVMPANRHPPVAISALDTTIIIDAMLGLSASDDMPPVFWQTLKEMVN